MLDCLFSVPYPMACYARRDHTHSSVDLSCVFGGDSGGFYGGFMYMFVNCSAGNNSGMI